MTVIRPNSISGITSLTAHRGSIDFYAHDGSAATFTNINSNVTSGVSTFASLNITGDLDVGGALTYEDVTNVDSVGVVTARDIIFSGSTGTAGQFVLRRDSDGANIGQFRSDVGTNDISIGNGGSGSLILKTGANTERLRITSAGNVGIGTDNPTMMVHIESGTPYIRSKNTAAPSDEKTWDFNAGTDGILRFRNINDAANSANNWLEVERNGVQTDSIRLLTGSGVERLRISSNGTTTVGPQYDQVKIEPGNGTYDTEATTLSVDGRTNDGNRVALKVDRYLSGTTATTKFSVKYDGSIFSTSGVQASSVNLQSSNTNSWFQTGANYGGTDYVWAAKDSSANVWHSGLQTDGDLWLGGNITGTSNIKLNGSNGSATFTGTIQADPFLLNANSSWMKSTYGAISNSTVSSLNNLMIGQNMRGWIGTRDGGSPTNNFYNIITHGGLGYCGTEYCYQGITKFYNNTGATTADATFTPNETVRIDTSGLTVNNGLRISTTSGGTTLANPYSIGLISTATIPSYPHFTGIWVVTGSIPCNNTWYDLLHSINDSNGLFHGYSGDASSKNIFQYQYSLTSPAYGVNNLSQRFMNGAWNTGSVSFQLRNNSGPWTLQMKATSHYNSNNNAGFRIMFHSYY